MPWYWIMCMFYVGGDSCTLLERNVCTSTSRGSAFVAHTLVYTISTEGNSFTSFYGFKHARLKWKTESRNRSGTDMRMSVCTNEIRKKNEQEEGWKWGKYVCVCFYFDWIGRRLSFTMAASNSFSFLFILSMCAEVVRALPHAQTHSNIYASTVFHENDASPRNWTPQKNISVPR